MLFEKCQCISWWFTLTLRFLLLNLCLADILVFKNHDNHTLEIIEDAPAAFGPALPPTGLKVNKVYFIIWSPIT